MSHSLEFQELYRYADRPSGIVIRVALRLGNQVVDLEAKLDTGSEYCVFQRQYGEQLGLTIEDGVLRRMEDVQGNVFETFGHEVGIEVLGFEVSSTVFFAKDPGFRRSVLGRTGWLNKYRVALVDYDREFYVSPYDQ